MSRRGQVWQLDMLPEKERKQYEGKKMRAEAAELRVELRKVERQVQNLVNRIVWLETSADQLDPPEIGWTCPYCERNLLKKGTHLNHCEAYKNEHLRDPTGSD